MLAVCPAAADLLMMLVALLHDSLAILLPILFIILALLSRSSPGVTQIRGHMSYSGPSSPLPTSVLAFIFIARRIQHFLPSSTRVELYLLSTLLEARSS